jgi:hypothetical protein
VKGATRVDAKPNAWPAAVVAIAILALVGAVTIAAIFNSNGNMAEALKSWDPVSALLALFTGAFVTFFFTRSAVESAQLQARNAMHLAAQEQRRADATHQARTKAVAMLDPAEGKRLLEDAGFLLATAPAYDACGTNGGSRPLAAAGGGRATQT